MRAPPSIRSNLQQFPPVRKVSCQSDFVRFGRMPRGAADMDFFSFMAVLIEHPLFALGPSAVLFYLFLVSRNRFILIIAIVWLAYVPYEYGMKYRVLCSG